VLLQHLPISVRLISEEEWLTYPLVRGQTRIERKRIREAIGRARNELLTAADPALRRSYGYPQAARDVMRDGESSPMPDLYKVIETVENALGGESTAIKILGVGTELRAVKRGANEGNRDERHAPKDPLQTRAPAEHGRAFAETLVVMRAYEKYLRSRAVS
jgi:hypothetical protein